MNSRNNSWLCLIALGLMALVSQQANALETIGCAAQHATGCTSCSDCKGCPKGCGKFQCDCQCNKACIPTRTTKKIKITCWVCECKMICLAGPSCGCQGTCGRSRVVKRLIRKTITKEVPIVKCKAVDATRCGCASGGGNAAPERATPTALKPSEASASYYQLDKSFSFNPSH